MANAFSCISLSPPQIVLWPIPCVVLAVKNVHPPTVLAPVCTACLSLHPASFKLYIDTVFEDKMQLLSDLVGRAADSGTPLDLHDLMYRFTLDSFGQIGFGVDPGCLRTTEKVPFAAAFDSAQVVSVYELAAAIESH